MVIQAHLNSVCIEPCKRGAGESFVSAFKDRDSGFSGVPSQENVTSKCRVDDFIRFFRMIEARLVSTQLGNFFR
jgi:hypothetical protein